MAECPPVIYGCQAELLPPTESGVQGPQFTWECPAYEVACGCVPIDASATVTMLEVGAQAYADITSLCVVDEDGCQGYALTLDLGIPSGAGVQGLIGVQSLNDCIDVNTIDGIAYITYNDACSGAGVQGLIGVQSLDACIDVNTIDGIAYLAFNDACSGSGAQGLIGVQSLDACIDVNTIDGIAYLTFNDACDTTGITSVNGAQGPAVDIGLGITGTDINLATTAAAWSATQKYQTGWVVTDSGSVYRATAYSLNDQPPSANWIDITGNDLLVVNIPRGMSIVEKTTDYTPIPGEYVEVDTSSGAVVITLPPSPQLGDYAWVKKATPDANAVVIKPTTPELIENKLVVPLRRPLTEMGFVYDGSAWKEMGADLQNPIREPAKVATTTALPAATYNNGTDGLGATITGNANGALPTIDGQTPALYDRIFVKDQPDPANNGLYDLIQLGDGSSPFILERAIDMGGAGQFPGASVPILTGLINSGNTFKLPSSTTPTVGTSDVLPMDYGKCCLDADYATTAAIPAATYNNGTGGVGATLTGNANGAAAAIDGQTPALYDLALIKNQADPVQNGPYILTQVGDGGSPFIWTRYPEPLAPGASIYTNTGTANGGSTFDFPARTPPTVGTNGISFSERRPQPPPVAAATVAPLPSVTYANGTGGIGATLTATANGAAAAIDGYTPSLWDLVWIQNQASGSENGLYYYTQIGDAGTPFILTRYPGFDASSGYVGVEVYILNGTTNTGRRFTYGNTTPPTVGTTTITAVITGGGSGWCNNTVSGGVNTLEASFGITSVTRNSVGNFTIAFAAFTSAETFTWSGSAVGDELQEISRTSSSLTVQTISGADPTRWGVMIAPSAGGSSTLAKSNLGIYSGSFSATGAATTSFAVVIGATLGSATYQALVTPANSLSAALLYVSGKTTTGFNVVYLAGLTGTVAFDWMVIGSDVPAIGCETYYWLGIPMLRVGPMEWNDATVDSVLTTDGSGNWTLLDVADDLHYTTTGWDGSGTETFTQTEDPMVTTDVSC